MYGVIRLGGFYEVSRETQLVPEGEGFVAVFPYAGEGTLLWDGEWPRYCTLAQAAAFPGPALGDQVGVPVQRHRE